MVYPGQFPTKVPSTRTFARRLVSERIMTSWQSMYDRGQTRGGTCERLERMMEQIPSNGIEPFFQLFHQIMSDSSRALLMIAVFVDARQARKMYSKGMTQPLISQLMSHQRSTRMTWHNIIHDNLTSKWSTRRDRDMTSCIMIHDERDRYMRRFMTIADMKHDETLH